MRIRTLTTEYRRLRFAVDEDGQLRAQVKDRWPVFTAAIPLPAGLVAERAVAFDELRAEGR